MKNPILSLVVLGSLVATLPAFAATELARINGTVITLEDFNKRYQENRQLLQFRSPSRKALLEELVSREVAVQEARKLKLDRDPEVIDRINTVLYYALLEKQLGKQVEGIHVTDDNAKAFYGQNPEVRTSHLFIAVPPNATDAEEKAAQARLKKVFDENVASGKMSFAEAAQRFSEGPSAPMGGDLDYQMRDRLDPAYYAAAIKLKPGKMSGIVRSQFGFHIIKLTALRAWEDADKAQIKRLVFEEKRNALFINYLTRLRAASNVQVKSALLKD